MSNKLSELKELVDIQCSDGNWNYDSYMRGMANGMLLSVAILEDKDPLYLNEPDEYLRDKPKTETDSIPTEA